MLLDKDNIPLGFSYKGFNVTPSDRKYYSEFLYKVHCYGNNVYRDIKLHEKLDTILFNHWNYQNTYTNKNRVLYLKDISTLDEILDTLPEIVEKVYGPVDEAHLEYVNSPWKNTDFKFQYREKLWYNKYDIKIDVISREKWTWNNPSSADLEEIANQFMGFIKEQSFDYYLYLTTEAKYWETNYLYCKTEDLKEIQPWISMLYSEVIGKINSAVLYSVDK